MKTQLQAAALVLATLFGAAPSLAAPANGPWQTATSLIGSPKYAPGFAHFDYVNPDAPKGGTVRLFSQGNFDTFNPFPAKGQLADGIGLVYQTLMYRSLDEDAAEYGQLADAVAYPPDISSATFRMNPNARWQDGTPVTAEDVKWSFDEETKLNPSLANYYHDVTKAEVTAPDQVTFTFDVAHNRELPNILGQLLILPKHWWQGVNAKGQKRDITASSLELPMGSGPYKLKSYNSGREVVYQRDPDYWAANQPIGIGENNFDTIKYEYFLDPSVAFQGFKADQFDWWEENRAKRWATAYDFPAVKEGRVVRELFPQPYANTGEMVGFVPNLRRPQFQNIDVRKALNYAFDFQSLQRTLFYGQYERINSYFFGTPLASSGLPQGQELQILDSIKSEVPASVFTTPYTNPVGGSPTKVRANLRTALTLFEKAGYKLDGNRLVDAKGNQLSFQILLNGPTIEPVATAFQTNLERLGVNVSIRAVDSAQYINRLRSRDFDMIYTGWAETLSPGNEQRDFWGSQSANAPGSSNYAGIANKGVDALIDKLVVAKDRATLIATTHALDRVLLANAYVVPSYAARNARVARWDRFGHPKTLPSYDIGFPTVWWYDKAKAAKVGGNN